MTFTREDAQAYAEANIERICAEQGITVRITDPGMLAAIGTLLRIGKERLDAERIEAARQSRRGNT